MNERTALVSESSASHRAATRLEMSPKEAEGVARLISTCLSRKNRAYADTGLGGGVNSVNRQEGLNVTTRTFAALLLAFASFSSRS